MGSSMRSVRRFAGAYPGATTINRAPQPASPVCAVCARARSGTRHGARRRTKEHAMSTIEESVEVEVPVRTAYNQWTQFEEFPRFMEGVERVSQLDDTHLHWVAEIAGVRREWDAEITEQHPDERVAWRATQGSENAGVVTVHRIAADRTRVMLQLDFDPDGLVESVGDKLGFVKRRASGDLERFKAFIEGRGVESGAWRGDVERPRP
jgi:uncharacterized membrane protein